MSQSARSFRPLLIAAGLGAALSLSACQTAEVYNQGYVIDEQALALVPVGSSREQVLLALGSPSTTATFDNEIFYYISQKRVRPMAFMQPRLVDQRVLAVYFGADGRVRQLANYGLQDGRVFDFISRTTPTGGNDQTFLGQLFASSDSVAPGAVPGMGQPRSAGDIGPQR